MKFFKNFNLFLAIALLATTFTACVDLEFDEPSLEGLADIAANTTIAELKALHTIGNDAVLVEDDLIIRGVVIADDLSGNFFKNLTIEDDVISLYNFNIVSHFLDWKLDTYSVQ